MRTCLNVGKIKYINELLYKFENQNKITRKYNLSKLYQEKMKTNKIKLITKKMSYLEDRKTMRIKKRSKQFYIWTNTQVMDNSNSMYILLDNTIFIYNNTKTPWGQHKKESHRLISLINIDGKILKYLLNESVVYKNMMYQVWYELSMENLGDLTLEHYYCV